MANSFNEEFHLNTGFLREHRKVWSLQNDVDLLNNMESFSQTLIKKTCFILDAMEEFQREINMTSIGVKTLSNTFEGVSDNQFVENRVYDEEDDMICEEERGKSDFVSSNLNKRLEESLKLCAKTLENKFEPVSITMSDFEDDDIFNNGEVILIPKNRYKSRPLPHLVGGKEFISDDSLGLLPSPDCFEEGGENIVGEVDTGHHSEASGSGMDDVDNCFQKVNLFIDKEDETKRPNTSDQNVGCLAQSNDNLWKDIDYEEEQQYIDEKFREVKKEHPSATQSFNPFNFQNRTAVSQMNTAVTDEIKGIFREENDDRPRLPIFLKPQSSIPNDAVKNDEDMDQIDVDSVTNPESLSANDISHILVKNNEKSILSSSIHSDANLNSISNKDKSDHIIVENGLPNIPTEVLHSFAKNRAKIKGKRRLPTRRSKSMLHSGEANVLKQEPADNVLSPSTDEEDLFVLPHTHIPKESSSNSLFTVPSLFSPGSSIEGDSKTNFTSKTVKKDDIESIKEEFLEEPLGIKKVFDTEKRNSNLFSDWDPFTSEESFLFSSVERKSRKMKLFDDFSGSSTEKSLKDNDDLFLFSSSTSTNSSSSLFSPSSSSSTVNFTSDSLDPLKGSKLFIDKNDVYSKSLFSSSNSGDLLFGSSEKRDKKLLNNEKIDKVSCSNPLMDTEDSLFD